MRPRFTKLIRCFLPKQGQEQPQVAACGSRKNRSRWFFILFVAMLASTAAKAEYTGSIERHNSGWSFQIDNDLLAGGDRDQNYTGGFIMSLSGRRAVEFPASPIRVVNLLDGLLGLNSFLKNHTHYSVHALEFGAALFTPVNIRESAISRQDRPYASLFFINGTRQSVIPSHKLSVRTSFAAGFLGLSLAESLQRDIHSAIGSAEPQGWDGQISQGGELTAKYSVGLQRAAFQHRFGNGLGQEFNWTAQVDFGFTTGVSVGGNWRFGKINTPWWSFNPHQSEYLNVGSNINASKSVFATNKERYVYAGFSLTHNAYNAFVQGQFRQSAFTVKRSDIVANIAEGWVGANIEMIRKYSVDLFLKVRSRELRLRDAESLAWGGIIISCSV